MEKRIATRLLITDTHSDNENAADIEDIFEQAFDICEQLGIERLTHLGDAFNSRAGQTLKVLLSVLKSFKTAAERGIIVDVIPGNHDKTNLEASESYLDLVKLPEKIHVYDDWSIEFLRRELHCYIPYFKEDTIYLQKIEQLTKRIQELQNSIPNTYDRIYLYTHVAITGVRNNGGIKVENALKYSMFKPFTKVFVGHYHNSSRVGKNIFYIGSARPKDFGEDDKKGFTVLYNDGTHEQIQAKFPKYIKHTIDLSKTNKTDIVKLINEYKESEDKVRFIFVGNPEKFAQYEQFLALAKKHGIDVKREDENILRAMEVAKLGGNMEFDYKAILQAFLQYCTKNKEIITPSRRALGLKYVTLIKDRHVAS